MEQYARAAGRDFVEGRKDVPLRGQKAELEDKYVIEYCGYEDLKMERAAPVLGLATQKVPKSVENYLVFWIRSHARNLETNHCLSPSEPVRLRNLFDHPNARVAKAAKEAARALDAAIPSARPYWAAHPPIGSSIRLVICTASIQWLDEPYAICRFEHPQKAQYGTVEREFLLADLPQGAKAGDHFELEIELDEQGRPVSYRPRMDSLVKAVPDPIEAKRPKLPRDLKNKAAMQEYDRQLNEYLEADFALDAERY